MQDDPQELTVPDVYGDTSKNLCNLLTSADEEEAPNLCDSLYYTESDFVDFIDSNKVQNENNLRRKLREKNTFCDIVFFSNCDHISHQHLSAGHRKTSHMSDTSYFIDLYTNWTLKDSIIK